MKPGDLAIVAHDAYNGPRGVLAGGTPDGRGAIRITVPFIVLAVLPTKPTAEHNIMLLGSNYKIGWLPKAWVTVC